MQHLSSDPWVPGLVSAAVPAGAQAPLDITANSSTHGAEHLQLPFGETVTPAEEPPSVAQRQCTPAPILRTDARSIPRPGLLHSLHQIKTDLGWG